MGAPDGAALAAADERVVDSLVGLGLLGGLNGEGVDDLDGLHGFACVVVLRFYFFSLPISVAVFSFNFFHDRVTHKKKGLYPSFSSILRIVLFGRGCVLCVNMKWCVRWVSPAGACGAAIAIGGATDEDIRAIPVHERRLGRRLDEDIDFTARLLEELLDFRHRAIVTDLIAVCGEVDEGVINARDVSREERDSTAELRVRDGDEVGLARHEDALDEDFASLELVGLGGERADGEPGEESGERARGCVLRGGHAWICLLGGTSILLLFPTFHCGGFLFQFF